MANQLLTYLGHPPLEDRSLAGFVSHAEQNMPVHPATARALGLEFATSETEYSYFGKTFTFETFIRYYAEAALAKMKETT